MGSHIINSQTIDTVVTLLLELRDRIQATPPVKPLESKPDIFTATVSNVRSNDNLEQWEPTTMALAAREYNNRRERDASIGGELMGEPSWDILLDLFICELKGKRANTKDAVIASCAPPTTALRYIDLLCERGMVQRKTSETDKRVTFLSLTKKAQSSISTLLLAQENRVRAARGEPPIGRTGGEQGFMLAS